MSRKIARIPKEILTLADGDTFFIPDGEGNSKQVHLTPERVRGWVENFKAMRKAGIRIPAPWTHKGLALPVNKGSKNLVMARANEGGMVDDASLNAGFWEDMEFDGSSLKAIIEAPGDPKDPNSPAGKIGTTVKEVSVFVAPEWQDGTGKKWGESILHIGCVCHPIETNQKNFELAEGETVIAMSMKNKPTPDSGSPSPSPTDDDDTSGESGVGENVLGDEEVEGEELSGGNVVEVISLLQQAVGIVLPASTTPKNFLERLEIALTQFQACSESDDDTVDDVTVPPEGATEKQAPFIMSFSPEQLSAFATAKVTNPATGKPWTLPELQEAAKVEAPAKFDESVIMSHPTVKGLVSTTEALLAATTEQAKAAYKARLDRLIQGGMSKEYVEGTLAPMVDSIVMSFENGKPKPQALDAILPALEAAIPQRTFAATPAAYSEFLAMSHGLPQGARTIGGLPFPEGNASGTTEPSQDEVNAKLKAWKERGLLG